VVAPREIGRLVSRVEHEPSLSAKLVHHPVGVLHRTIQMTGAVGAAARSGRLRD
jgi:hypothetical protein